MMASRMGRRVTVTRCDECDAWYLMPSGDMPGRAHTRWRESQTALISYLALGLRDPEIARELGVTEIGVKLRIHRLMVRTGALSRPNLVAIAIVRNWIDPWTFAPNAAMEEPPNGTAAHL